MANNAPQARTATGIDARPSAFGIVRDGGRIDSQSSVLQRAWHTSRPSRKRPRCAVRRRPSMSEGRAERAVEALAKSIDGAEHSGMMKGVMAVAQIGGHDRPHVLGHSAPEV